MAKDILADLHELLAKELTKRLKEGEIDKDGEVVPIKAPTLNVIRQFLKDNSIDGLPTEGSALGELLSQLPEEFKKGTTKGRAN